MKKFALLVVLLFAVAVFTGCVVPPPTPAAPPAAPADEAAVSDQEVSDSVEASSDFTTTATLGEVDPTDLVLSVDDLWPGWLEGLGEFSVPVGYEAWMTTDPGTLYRNGDPIAFGSFPVRTVVLLSEGQYLLETYHSAAGNINAWMEASPAQYFEKSEAPTEQAQRMHDMENNPAPIVDLRLLTASPVPPVVPTATSTAPIPTATSPAPAAPVATATTSATSVTEACVPDYDSFVEGYDDPNATSVVLVPAEGHWVVAGHDPAVVNGGRQTVDKAVTIVAPGAQATITGLGRDSATGRAYIYACQLSAAPTMAYVQMHVDRESKGGRTVEVIPVGFELEDLK